MLNLTAPVLRGDTYTWPYTSVMAKRKIMGVQEARQNFAAVVAAAARDGEQTILFRRSTPAAVVVSAEWFHRAAQLMGEPWEDWTPPNRDEPA
jgi:prevent-host-death family protein